MVNRSVLKHCKVPKYHDQDCRFNGVYSRNNLPRIKDGVSAINQDDEESKGTYWVSLFINISTAVYFDSFGIKYFRQEVLSKIEYESILHNVFSIQFEDSIKFGFYCITFTEHMIAGKTLLDYTNLFSLNDYKK